MDVATRIRRRQRRDGPNGIVHEYAPLSPVAHVEDPSDRGPVLERLLDHLDPVFDGELPGNGHVWGPPGSGKSAVLTALCRQLDSHLRGSWSAIHTATRAESRSVPTFVYVDARETGSEFALYRRLLDHLIEESVPRHGVGTDAIRDRLRTELARPAASLVAVVDHVGERATLSSGDVATLLGRIADDCRWICAGRHPPEDGGWDRVTDGAIEVPGYRTGELVDVVMTRAGDALARRALEHGHARQIAEWADGNAHDALAALLVAADRAERDGRDRIEEADVVAAIAEIPRQSVSLGRVLTLAENRQSVLRALVALDDDECSSVTSAAEAIADAPSIDLSTGTVTRFLYELSEDGILERIERETAGGQGRPPSRLEVRFPPTAFARLYDGSGGERSW